MSPTAPRVFTLVIDGKDVSGREDETANHEYRTRNDE